MAKRVMFGAFLRPKGTCLNTYKVYNHHEISFFLILHTILYLLFPTRRSRLYLNNMLVIRLQNGIIKLQNVSNIKIFRGRSWGRFKSHLITYIRKKMFRQNETK